MHNRATIYRVNHFNNSAMTTMILANIKKYIKYFFNKIEKYSQFTKKAQLWKYEFTIKTNQLVCYNYLYRW